MNGSDLIKAIEPVINTFEKLNIGYYIGGSIASSLLGIPRATNDIDIVSTITLNNIDDLFNALKSKFYIDKDMIADAIINHSSFNIINIESMLKIDVFILKEREYDKESFLRKKIDSINEGEKSLNIYISSSEDIILSKLEWIRIGSEISERQWNDIRGVIRVQDKNLDLDYLKKWSKELKINDLLEKVLNESE